MNYTKIAGVRFQVLMKLLKRMQTDAKTVLLLYFVISPCYDNIVCKYYENRWCFTAYQQEK